MASDLTHGHTCPTRDAPLALMWMNEATGSGHLCGDAIAARAAGASLCCQMNRIQCCPDVSHSATTAAPESRPHEHRQLPSASCIGPSPSWSISTVAACYVRYEAGSCGLWCLSKNKDTRPF